MGIEGIIRPPPDIRAVADKTAIFVAKNGRDFEKRILNSAKGKTPKFAFLHESSPFHAYYEDRIVFYAKGGAEEEKKKEEEKENEEQLKKKDGKKEHENESPEDGRNLPKESSKTTRKAKSIVDPVAKSLLAQRAKIKLLNEKPKHEEEEEKTTDNKNNNDNNEEKKEADENDKQLSAQDIVHPPKIIYTTPIPPKEISQCQLEIIKTTAQFAALNHGNNTNKQNNPFLRELTVLEWENPIYGFLQPRHAHYAYFTQLVDIYIRILQRSVLLHEQNILKKKDDDQTVSLLAMTSLKRMVGMDGADFEEATNVQLKNEIQAVDNMANDIYKCLNYAAYQAEYDRFNEEKRLAELEKMMNEEGGNGMLGGSSRVDWYDFVVVETIDFPVDEVVESLPPPPPPLPPPPQAEVKEPIRYDAMDVDDDDDDDDKEEIKVVSDYAPKVVSAQDKFSSESRTHVIDPITKKSIPIADMSEHMRIQLLDPKWAAEKERFMEKQKDSNLVGGDMIARNVDAFTKARGFGSSTSNGPSIQATADGSGANDMGSEQSVGPQPIGGMATAPPPPTQHHHDRPPMSLPDAKRVRVGDVSASQGQPMQLQMPPPVVLPPPPVPPPPHAAAPIEEKDTETIVVPTKMSEADFADSLSSPMVDISIIVPNDTSYSSWNFNGQTINVSIDVMTKIKGLKQKLQPQLGGMPVNKMQLKSPDVGFLKDAFSLAKLNIASHSPAIELVPKVRGGRK